MDTRTAAWVRQLYREYDDILYQYGLLPMRAVLQVAPLSRHWGQWDPDTQSITLATQLIEGHSWDVVLEVLKHEMAHQWAGLHAPSQAPHGAAFATACRLLGMPAWSSACTSDLPMTCAPGGHRHVSPEERRLLDKVEKLLSLATSSNEHEAGLAMQRARQILARYNLERTAAPPQDAFTYVVVHRRRRRTCRTESRAVALLVEHFHVRAVHTTLFDRDDLCEYRAVELMGEHRHVALAEYVYHFLLNTVQALYEQYRREHGGAQRQAYMAGVMLGFGQKLANDDAHAAAAPSAQQCALVRVVAQQLRAYAQTRYPKISRRSTRGARYDADALQAGRQAGQRIVLNRAISGQAVQGGKLLDAPRC